MSEIKEVELQKWSRIMMEQSESGETVENYCKAKGISSTTYYKWHKILKDEDEKQGYPVFLPVRTNSSENTMVTIRINGIELEYASNIPEYQLKKLVRCIA